MRALRKTATGPGHVELVNIPEPVPQENQVRLRVAFAGICGTDLHIYHGKFAKIRPPVTLGHEVSGIVDAVGEGVKRWRPGDRVIVESEAHTCGTCEHCRNERTNLCAERLALGYGVDGGFADNIIVRQSALHRLPEDVSLEEGALCEPLCVAVHAVLERSRMKRGDWVLVTGPGPIGLLVLQVARAAGGRAIITGTARDSDRLRLAEKLGAEAAIQVDLVNIRDQIDHLTQGGGVTSAFECSGMAPAMSDCLHCVRSGGEIVQVGLYGAGVLFDVDQIAMREIAMRGAFVHTHETWNKAIELMVTDAVDLKALISGNFPIAQWKNAFQRSESAKGVKYLLHPGEIH